MDKAAAQAALKSAPDFEFVELNDSSDVVAENKRLFNEYRQSARKASACGDHRLAAKYEQMATTYMEKINKTHKVYSETQTDFGSKDSLEKRLDSALSYFNDIELRAYLRAKIPSEAILAEIEAARRGFITPAALILGLESDSRQRPITIEGEYTP